MKKQKKKEMFVYLIISSLIIINLFSIIYLSLFFSTSNLQLSKSSDKIFIKIKPELINNVLIIYTQDIINAKIDNKHQENIGLYIPLFKQLNLILIDINMKDHWYMNNKRLLCHELMHHKWSYDLSEEDKQIWRNSWEYGKKNNKDWEEIYPNPNEYYAEIKETNLKNCYTKEVFENGVFKERIGNI